jgi:hypothetical protein
MTQDGHSTGLLTATLRASVKTPAFLMVALVTRWLQDGSAEAIIGAIRDEAAARQKLASDVLSLIAFSRHPNGHHIWIPLPRAWASAEFASHVQRQGDRNCRDIQRRGNSTACDPGFTRCSDQPLRATQSVAVSYPHFVHLLLSNVPVRKIYRGGPRLVSADLKSARPRAA